MLQRNAARRQLIHIAPVGAGAHFDHQRNREFVDSFHFFLDQLPEDVFPLTGASKSSSSWTCRIILAANFLCGGARRWIMASLMRSAAVPCKGVFSAVRSAKFRNALAAT